MVGPSRLHRAAAAALAALAGGGVSAGAYAVADGPGRATTYAGASSIGELATFAAGTGLVAASVVLALAPGSRRSAWVALLASVAWLAPVWVAWQEGLSLVRSLAAVFGLFMFAAVAHLVIGRPSTQRDRIFLLALYGEASVAALLLALFRAPFRDPSCWANCTTNSFLVTPLPGFAADVASADRYAVWALAVALIAMVVNRARRASQIGRRLELPAVASAIAVGASFAAHQLAVQRAGADDPFRGSLQVTFELSAAAVLVAAAVAILNELFAHKSRRAVARAAAQLDAAPQPGAIAATLARALDDPELRVTYPVGSSRYVDAAGRDVPPPESATGRRSVQLRRHGPTLAVIEHRASLGELERAFTPSLLIGLENERLRAAVLAQLKELRGSRARIVEASDAERRRLERDLHDGVQQRLLALSYTLRVARGEAAHEVQAAATLDKALRQTETALDQLREIAHGIYPAVLAEVGLGAALRSLQDTAPLTVRIPEMPARRVDGSVEAVVYFLVAAAVEDAERRGAASVTVAVDTTRSRTIVTIEDDADLPASQLTELADRIGALNGILETSGNALTAEVPCA